MFWNLFWRWKKHFSLELCQNRDDRVCYFLFSILQFWAILLIKINFRLSIFLQRLLEIKLKSNIFRLWRHWGDNITDIHTVGHDSRFKRSFWSSCALILRALDGHSEVNVHDPSVSCCFQQPISFLDPDLLFLY